MRLQRIVRFGYYQLEKQNVATRKKAEQDGRGRMTTNGQTAIVKHSKLDFIALVGCSKRLEEIFEENYLPLVAFLGRFE